MPPETTPAAGAAFSMKTIIGIIAAVVIVGGGGYWFTSQNGENVGTAGMPVPDGTGTERERVVSGSLADILKSGETGENYTCIITATDGSLEQVVFSTREKTRVESTLKTQGASITSFSIQKNGEVYIWTNLSSQGFIIKVGNIADPPANLNYDCNQWIPDESKFVLPSDVSFIVEPGP